MKALKISLAVYCSVFLLAGNIFTSWNVASCRTSESMTDRCEMECCETDCCTEMTEGPAITSRKDCCEIQNSHVGDLPLQPISINISPDANKNVYHSSIIFSVNTVQAYLTYKSPPGRANHSYLQLQNLRI